MSEPCSGRNPACLAAISRLQGAFAFSPAAQPIDRAAWQFRPAAARAPAAGSAGRRRYRQIPAGGLARSVQQQQQQHWQQPGRWQQQHPDHLPLRAPTRPAAAGAPGEGQPPPLPPGRDPSAVLLLDLLLPHAAPDDVCHAIFGCWPGDSNVCSEPGLLVQFLEQGLGCTHIACEPWHPCGSSSASSASSAGSAAHLCRLLSYATPLTTRQRLLLPLGPAAVPNRDEQRMDRPPSGDSGSGSGITVHCRCTSSGVPFSDSFANLLSWQLTPQVTSAASATVAALQPVPPCATGTRVLLTARCAFHRPVLGPLRGQIERESMQGMRDVYLRFGELLLAQQFSPGPGAASSRGSTGISNATRSSFLSSGSLSSGSLSRGSDVSGGAPSITSAAAAAGAAAAASSLPASAAAAVAGRNSGPGGDSTLDGSTAVKGELEGADSSGRQVWVAARQLARRRVTANTVEGVLAQVEALWPEWSAAGCCLAPPAAAAQKRATRAAKAAGAAASAGPTAWKSLQRLRGGAGLEVAASADAPGPLAGAPAPDEAAALLRVVACRALAAGMPQPARRQLARHRVVRGLVEALRLQPRPRARQQPLQQQQLRSSGAVGRALWAMAQLGGSVYWEEETEGLCSLLPSHPFDSLHQVSDAVFALAVMRHYTPNLPLLEQQAVVLLQGQLQEQLQQGEASDTDSGRDSNSSAGQQAGRGSGLQGEAAPAYSRVVSLLWGLASLGHRPTLLLDQLPAVLSSTDGGGGGASAHKAFGRACTLCWALAAADCLQHPALPAAAAELAAAVARLPAGRAPKSSLLQVHQFALALRTEAAAPSSSQDTRNGVHSEGSTASESGFGGGSLTGVAAGSAPAVQAFLLLTEHPQAAQLLADAAAAWEAEGQQRSNKTVSACQADVAATARSGLGFAVQEEYSVAGISVDIAVPSRRLAIEVDGPTHFCRGGSSRSVQAGGQEAGPAALQQAEQVQQTEQPLGSTLLKRRLLRGQGWAVASVSSQQWERVRGGPAEKRRLLQAAISAAEADEEE